MPPGSRDVVAEAARRAFIGGLNDILIIAALVAFAGAVAALLLVRSSDLEPQAQPPPRPSRLPPDRRACS